MNYLVVCKTRDDAEDAFNFAKRLAASGIGLGCNNFRLIIYTRMDEYHFLSKSAYLRKFEGTKAYEIISLHDFENEISVKWRERNERKKICEEGKLDEFIAMNIPYAQIKFDDDEYCGSHSCTRAYQTAIRRYEKEDILDCRTINGKTFLINKKLGGSLNV